MRAKFKGGPQNGKVADIRDGEYELLVPRLDPKVNLYADRDFDLYAPLPYQKGSYKPSNTILKNGTRIWQWMGWFTK